MDLNFAARYAGAQLAKKYVKNDQNDPGGGCCGCLVFIILFFVCYGAAHWWQ